MSVINRIGSRQAGWTDSQTALDRMLDTEINYPGLDKLIEFISTTRSTLPAFLFGRDGGLWQRSEWTRTKKVLG